MTQDSTEHFQARIDSWKAQAESMQRFADNYAKKLPIGVAHASLDSYEGGPKCSISTGYTAEGRTRALALAGEVFGTHGWVKTLNRDKDFYHWKREIDGVEVTIYKAESIPVERENQPVPPAAFPIMLKEVDA